MPGARRSLLLLCGLLAWPAAAGAAPLQVREGRFVDGQGRMVVLRGLDAGRSLSAREVRRAAAYRFNAVRLRDDWPRAGDRGRRSLRRSAARAQRAGLFVLVAGEERRGSFTGFAGSAVNRTRFAADWARMARGLRGLGAVAGFDPLERPACDAPAGCGTPEATERWLRPVLDEATAAMRSVDPGHVVFAEDWAETSAGAARWLAPIAEGLAFGVRCGGACAQQTVRGAREAAEARDAAPMLTPLTGGPSRLREVGRLADEAGLGWIAAAHHPRGATLRALARPYPQRIAGDDASWTWDEARGRLTLTWRPRGRGQTVVGVPRLGFSRGWEAGVRGGAIRRGRGSRTVLVRTPRGVTSARLVLERLR